MMQTLKNQRWLEVQTEHNICVGGSQEWFCESWQRMSGCGPTAAANLIWYLARSRSELGRLCDVGCGGKVSFVKLMTEMFSYITPGFMGVNTSSIFTAGIRQYGAIHHASLTSHVLEIPKLFPMRPTWEKTREFVLSALQSDCPVAFLNLSNGNQDRLDGWHWVTILALDSEDTTACICDQGRLLTVDLAAWLKTSLLGGALVYLTAEKSD